MAEQFAILPSGQAPNPQLLAGLLLVTSVRQDVQALLPESQASGTVTVSERDIRRWLGTLEIARNQVERVPVPLIYPPPAFSVFSSAALDQIAQAQAIIRSVPVATPLVFPPVPGQAVISLDTLLTLFSTLEQAEANLRLALQTA